MPAYRYAADQFVATRWNEQKQNIGMLEFHIDPLGIPGGQEILILSFKAGTIPGRKFGRGQIEYLNGNIFYPTRPEPLGEMSVTFRDFIDSLTRLTIERWCRKVHDERTGFMGLTNSIKTTAHLVLFGPDGVSGLRTYLLRGVFPLGLPDIPLDHASGEQLTMEMSFSVDSIVGDRL